MITFIIIVTLLISLLGIWLMLSEKIPILLDLPDTAQEVLGVNFISRVKGRIESQNFVKNFSYETFLQKLLSKVKTLALKTDNKTSLLLQKLREKSKEENMVKDDNYWEEIKKSTRKKDRK